MGVFIPNNSFLKKLGLLALFFAFAPSAARAGGQFFCLKTDNVTGVVYNYCHVNAYYDYCIPYRNNDCSYKPTAPASCYSGSNGTISNANCTANTGIYPPVPPTYDCTSPNGMNGDTVAATCPTGYTGNRSQTCTGGTWKLQDLALSSCVEKSCNFPTGAPGEIQSFSCPTNYTGTVTKKCSLGFWQTQTSACTPIPTGCTSPTGTDGQIIPEPCPASYTGSRTKKCTSGTWNYTDVFSAVCTLIPTGCTAPTGTNGQTISEPCPASYTGTRTKKCTSGIWSYTDTMATACTLVPVPPNNCTAPFGADGATRSDANACPMGQTGSIYYKCIGSAWVTQSSTCALAVSYCSNPTMEEGSTRAGPACPMGQAGSISFQCTNAAWVETNTCVVDTASLANAELIAAQDQATALQTTFTDLSVQHKDVAANNNNTSSSISNYSGVFAGFNGGLGATQTTTKGKLDRVTSGISGTGSSGGFSNSLTNNAYDLGKKTNSVSKGSKSAKAGATNSGISDSAEGQAANGASGKNSNAALADANGKNKSGADGKYKTFNDSQPYNDPWLAFMSGKGNADLVEQLRKDPDLREKIRKALREKKKKNIASIGASESLSLLEDALEEAEHLGDSQETLQPLSAKEAFSMDADETARSVKRMLAELDDSEDPQFLAKGTLFERVSLTYTRNLKRGLVK